MTLICEPAEMKVITLFPIWSSVIVVRHFGISTSKRPSTTATVVSKKETNE